VGRRRGLLCAGASRPGGAYFAEEFNWSRVRWHSGSMRLYASVVPPAGEVAALLTGVSASGDASLSWSSDDRVRIGLCFFGNLVHSDALRLTTRLGAAIAEVEPFRLCFEGGDALAEPGDDSVWVDVVGDLDQLRGLAFATADVARKDGLTVDRRWFKPRARIARINDATTTAGLQATVGRLQAYQGAPWRVTEVAFTAERVSSELSGPLVTARLPLRAKDAC
jgi:2'-5' RNA ligase